MKMLDKKAKPRTVILPLGKNREKLSSARVKPGIYLHYKGKKYKVHGMAKDSDTIRSVVVYETLYKNPLSRYWVRDAENFLEKVEINGKMQTRYRYLGKD
jgi:hypothetical protein